MERLTKADARVFVANILTLLIGEEHVCGETTLWGIGICHGGQSPMATRQEGGMLTLLLLLDTALGLATGGFLGFRHLEG